MLGLLLLEQGQLEGSAGMASVAEQQGDDASPAENARVSHHDTTHSEESGTHSAAEVLGLDAAISTSLESEVNMEEAVETSSEETPTATSKPVDRDSVPRRMEEPYNTSKEDAANMENPKDSHSLRPRTDSNLSRGSSEVNWEELQKTEDEHVQEEGSDEVPIRL